MDGSTLSLNYNNYSNFYLSDIIIDMVSSSIGTIEESKYSVLYTYKSENSDCIPMSHAYITKCFIEAVLNVQLKEKTPRLKTLIVQVLIFRESNSKFYKMRLSYASIL
jgi:hypothetical protein